MSNKHPATSCRIICKSPFTIYGNNEKCFVYQPVCFWRLYRPRLLKRNVLIELFYPFSYKINNLSLIDIVMVLKSFWRKRRVCQLADNPDLIIKSILTYTRISLRLVFRAPVKLMSRRIVCNNALHPPRGMLHRHVVSMVLMVVV